MEVHRLDLNRRELRHVAVRIHQVQVVDAKLFSVIAICELIEVLYNVSLGSSSGRRSSGSRHVSSTTVTSTEAQSQSNNNPTSNNASAPPGGVNNSSSTVNGQSVDANNVPAALPAPPVNPTLKCKSHSL